MIPPKIRLRASCSFVFSFVLERSSLNSPSWWLPSITKGAIQWSPPLLFFRKASPCRSEYFFSLRHPTTCPFNSLFPVAVHARNAFSIASSFFHIFFDEALCASRFCPFETGGSSVPGRLSSLKETSLILRRPFFDKAGRPLRFSLPCFYPGSFRHPKFFKRLPWGGDGFIPSARPSF